MPTLNDFPGPRGFPLLGNLMQLDPTRTYQILCDWADQYGSVFAFRIGNRRIVTITDTALIDQMLRERPERFRRWSKLEELALEVDADGVFVAEGEKWRRHRKMVMYALNHHHVRQFGDRLEVVTRRLKQRWETVAKSGKPVDMRCDLMRYTVDVVSGFAFGHDLNTLEDMRNPIQQHLSQVFEAAARRQTALFPYWRYIKLPADRALDAALTEVNKTIQEMIVNARDRLAASPALQTNPTNLLEALVAVQSTEEGTFTDAEIVGNVLTLLLVGEDTTANTLSWVIYFMAQYPEVQEKMQIEIDSILNTVGRPLDIKSLDQLPYIEAVVKETLRQKPIFPLVALEPHQDIDIHGVDVPKGTPLFLLTGHLGRQDANFTNAHLFLPERWLDSEKNAQHNLKGFLPFGAGSRYCPGQRLAMSEIMAVLAMLAKNFTVSQAASALGIAPTREHYAFTLCPTHVTVTLKQRH
ncbi:cytochrome P450 [Glaciimonas sp. GG7]